MSPLLLAIPIGLLIGLSLGGLGAGGSILAVPALVLVLGQNAHQATTVSLAIVGATALVGAAVHWRAGRVRPLAGVTFGVLGAGGAYLGARASAGVDSSILLLGFAVVMVFGAVAMLLGRGGARQGLQDPPPERGRGVRWARTVVAALAVGLLTGFFGVGGGFIAVPALVLVVGLDTPAAVGTSLLVIAINSAVALATRLGSHIATPDWSLLVSFAVAGAAGTLVGGRISTRVRPRHLTVAFSVVVISLAVYTAARSLTHLL